MLVKGHSGFGVELVDELTIRKSVTGAGADRLKKQIEKQVLFQSVSRNDRIRAPKIFQMTATANSFHADMEFIAAKDFVQFLSEADRQALDDFWAIIAEFIQGNLGSCQSREVSEEVRRKLTELQAKGVAAVYVSAARSLCTGPVHVPVGVCHGDLTLSNILFKNDHLYLIDFLDCFVESPLQDIVKLRQDTFFGWSLALYQAEFNWPRVQIALRYLDQKIVARFQSDDWYQQHYALFQLVNLMRVLPYCAEKPTTELITAGLNQMLLGMKDCPR